MCIHVSVFVNRDHYVLGGIHMTNLAYLPNALLKGSWVPRTVFETTIIFTFKRLPQRDHRHRVQEEHHILLQQPLYPRRPQ